MTKLFVKNMVCQRCIKVVTEELKKLGYTPKKVILGEVDIEEELGNSDLEKIGKVLLNEGFELLKNENQVIVEKIKTLVIETINSYDKINLEKVKFSKLISSELNKNYVSLSTLFSKQTGITIEKYIILQKIEKAKELLSYGNMQLSEIAYLLGYKSVQHLSRQFKEITGTTAKEFKRSNKKRNFLDKI